MSWQFRVVTVANPEHYILAAQLFQEYAASLSIGLCFQDFDTEVGNLAAAYQPPDGAIFLAQDNGLTGGCCAVRPLHDVNYANACEMKRLYVKPEFRGLGIGRDLADQVLCFAKDAGYDCVLLDTLSEMETARSLYDELGFVEIEPYYHNPIPGAHYLMVTF